MSPLAPPVAYRKTQYTHRYGLAAARPAATDVLIGTFYYSSDTQVLARSNGTTWDSILLTTGPLPYLDLVEGVPASPAADTERLYALDVNGYTQVEMKDSAGRGARLASDNILIAKITEPAGMTRGQLAYIQGATGANPLIRLAKSDAIATMPTIGLVLDTGALNAFTRVLLSGTIQGLDTSAFVEGVSLFVSPTTAGALTATLPVAPDYAQRVGFVTRSHATQGELLVLTTGTVTDPRLHHTTHEPGGTDQIQNVAWTNLANVFTQEQEISESGGASLYLTDPSQGSDLKKFRIINTTQQFIVQPTNDAGAGVPNLFVFDRAGNGGVTGTFTATGGLATTPLNATNLTSGTIPDARLSANVALENIQNIFTVDQAISVAGGASLIIGDPTQGANLKYFRIISSGPQLLVQPVSDAGAPLGTSLIVNRAGDLNVIGTLLVGGSIVSLLGGQIGFPITQIPSANPNVLDDYEEGTWTPFDNSGAGLVLASVIGQYVKIGTMIFWSLQCVYPATASAAPAKIGGLPYINSSGATLYGGYPTFTTVVGSVISIIFNGTADVSLYPPTGGAYTNANLTTAVIVMAGMYREV